MLYYHTGMFVHWGEYPFLHEFQVPQRTTKRLVEYFYRGTYRNSLGVLTAWMLPPLFALVYVCEAFPRPKSIHGGRQDYFQDTLPDSEIISSVTG